MFNLQILKAFMIEDEFDKIDAIADKAAEKYERLVNSGEFKEFSEKINKFIKETGAKYSIELSLNIDIVDYEKEHALNILNCALCHEQGEETLISYGNMMPNRFLVNGEIVKVPADDCPNCWGEWDYKLHTRFCPECGYELGSDVKFVVDDDICPHCLSGKIDKNFTCSHCEAEFNKEDLYLG